MANERSAYCAESPPHFAIESLPRGTVPNDAGEVRRLEIRLQEALAREKALLHQKDELLQQQAVLSKLLAWREEAAERVASLTSRQRQIMDLVLAGRHSKNIAHDLGIAQRTVENHRAAVMKRTGSKSLPALARFALAAAWNESAEPFVKPMARLALAAAWNDASAKNSREQFSRPRHKPPGPEMPTPERNSARMHHWRKDLQMIANSRRILKSSIRAAAVLVALLAAACAQQYSSPQEVRASNPSVTYKYRSDQELIQANQNAVTFCNRYQAFPQTVNFRNDPDGSKVVIFECVQTNPSPQPQFNPNLTYTYRTDQELLEASRNAQNYCRSNGSQQVISNVVNNANGSRTVTFQCSPR
jgi:DNA-binding CsgD family transcriptional regulator